MNTYETVFIVTPAISFDESNGIFVKFKELIAANGEVLHSEFWGKLKMSYPINKQKEGNYYLIQYNASGDFNKELETRFKYDENVLRFVVVKIDGKRYKLRKREEMTKPRAKRYEEKPQAETVAEQTESVESPSPEQEQSDSKE